MASRSRFYVETPRDPSQRHSMFVSHSELEQRQDLSSNSSSATLPSASGSVDRLTGLEEKKSPGFFTLKPKSSFSLRPFFKSSSSLISLSPTKRRKVILERRDSCVQTEENRPVLGEVGVQTLNASTVDVPVQTCLEAWEEGDSYGHRRLAYASTRTSPFWSRPSVASSTLSSPLVSTYVPKDPLASPKVVKYAVPGESHKPALFSPSAVSPADVNSRQPVSPPLQTTSSCSSSVPVKYFSVKELTGNPISLSVDPQSEGISKIHEPAPEEKSVQTSSFSPDDSPPVKNDAKDLSKNETTAIKESAAVDKQIEVSDNLKQSVIHNVELPCSALKVERTDSPSKRTKTVHFDLPNSDIPKQVNDNSNKSRNVDKDFEALLRDLNVLTDDEENLKISFNNVSRDKPPSSTLLSPNLRSALDALKQDFLAPIPENLNEREETEENIKIEDGTLTDKDKNSSTNPSVESNATPSSPRKKLTRKISEYENVPKSEEIKNNSPVTPTPLTIFTSANSVASVETDSLEKNVYNNIIKEENPVKTAPLPILPSFFEPLSHSQSSESTEIVEYGIDTENTPTLSDNQPQLIMPLESDFERNRLSRSSSRSSIQSGSKTAFDASLEPVSKFDSCENLDQLEEEIIRSLYSPEDDKLEENIKNMELPPSESFQNSGTTATHMRRVILDQLLSGKNVEDIVPKYPVYQRTHSVPEGSCKYKPVKKYTAVLTRMEHDDSEIPSDQNFPPVRNGCDFFPKAESNGKVSGTNYTNANKFEPVKKTSIFLFPEENRPNSELKNKTDIEISTDVGKNANILEVRRSSWTAQTTAGSNSSNSPSLRRSESPASEKGNKTGQCDFTNCLRPSKIQNSPFLAKINTRSMSPCNFSPLPPLQSNFTSVNNSSKRHNSPPKQPEATGECDYASCLKPSQVQNTLFTAELSEITAGKSSNSLRAGSPLTVSSSSPFTAIRSTSVERSTSPLVSTEIKYKSSDNPEEPVKHKSEFLITLKTTSKHSSEVESKPEEPEEFKTHDDACQKINKPSCSIPEQGIEPSQNSEASFEILEPPPPAAPPLPSHLSKTDLEFNKMNGTTVSPMEFVIKETENNTTKADNSTESQKFPPKESVMAELEERIKTQNIEPRWRNSDDKDNDQTSSTHPVLMSNEQKSENNVNNSSSYYNNNNGNRSQNGNISILSEPREQNPSTFNGKNNENLYGPKLTFSPNTIITDEPPPPGAVLLDKKVTVEGDKVHTDRYFAIPVKEVLKEKTSTTTFIPAPPKYEGIGPTEDGIPIGLRNSVKKENMHSWYKTMFKSLHKADSPNESEEYIIGYTSEPETSRKDMVLRKKSSTLDSRNKYDANSNVKQNYPPSAKSSIEVYNVRPRLIEDYEPGHSSVTDNVPVISRRYLPALNTPKTSYEFKNGYESDTTITRKREQPEALSFNQQKQCYREIQKGGDIPQFGLGKPTPEKPKEPSIGPVPPPPLNYNGPSTQQAVRPLTLPADYINQNGNSYCQQMNGLYEMQMRNALHSEMQHRMSPSSNQLSPPNRTMAKSPSKSPDMKILGQALFDFKAESPKEIPLKKGDMVMILRQLDKNWYEGEYKGVLGIFPISYVEIVPPEHASTPIKPRIEGLGKALFDFVAQTPIELAARKGDTISLIRRVDANWFEASFNNKKGIIPISYIQVLQEPIDRNINSPSQKSYSVSPNSESKEKLQVTSSVSPSTYSPSSISPLPLQMQNNSERRKFTNKKTSQLVEPVMYRALYSYSPQNSDELELQEGDSVYVVEMCDDGWYVGTSVRTGVFGIFPGNYVEKAC